MKTMTALLGALLAATALAAQVTVTLSCQDPTISISPVVAVDAGQTKDAGVADAGTKTVDAGGPAPVLDAGAPDAGQDAGTVAALASDGGQWVMGYYVGYQINQYPISSIDWTGLSHIAFGALLANPDGSLNTGFYDQNGTGPADAVALSTAAHAHGVKAMIMLGGQGGGANLTAATAPATLTTFVNNLLSTMDGLGYDGIDIDWEDSVNYAQFAALAQALRVARPHMLLSWPVGSVNANFPSIDPNVPVVAQYMDRVFVMSYYPATEMVGGGWSSWFTSSPITGETGTTPSALDFTLNDYAGTGIPKSKLGLGMAFFGTCLPPGITAPRQTTNGISGSVNGGDNYLPLTSVFSPSGPVATNAAGLQRDSLTQQPYLSLATPITVQGCGTQQTQYVTFEDETSIIAKGTWSKANGYGGAMVWTIQQGWLYPNSAGGRAQNALMQALRQGFLQ